MNRFFKKERNKILSVRDLLTGKDTLDELEIAPVRDGFANLFFSGTSIIQTRAKYFFIVPYALKELEYSKETNPNRIAKAFDQIERDCAEQFLGQNQNEQGIIGKRSLLAGNWVKRTPADIYWSGLRQYGIFKGGNLSLSEYIRASCTLKKQKSSLQNLGNRNDNVEDADSDDKNAGNLFKMQFWKCPTYTFGWKDKLNIGLTSAKKMVFYVQPQSAGVLRNILHFIRNSDFCDTYVKNKDAQFGGAPHEVSGMLLYARTDETIQPDGTYKMSGNKISVRTLGFNQEFSVIALQMNAIVEEHFGTMGS